MSTIISTGLAILLLTCQSLATKPKTTIPSTFITSTTSSSASSLPTNPVKLLGVPKFLGNVTSSNTGDIRDLGYQGSIGKTFINTYGDTIPCSSYQKGCYGLGAPNSASVVTAEDDVLQYTDLKLGPQGKHATIFCPLSAAYNETNAWGLGLTNVVDTGKNRGVVFFVRNDRTKNGSGIVGSGVAHISIDKRNGTNITCTRPEAQFWSADEPWFADHGAVLAGDGYVYAFGGARAVNGSVFLARVPQKHARRLKAYEYWNGTAFTGTRLVNPSPSQAVFASGQGSIVFNKFYNKYLYFKPGCPGGACLQVMASDKPQGPWSKAISFWGTGSEGNTDGYGMYAPLVQPRWSSSDGRSVVVMYTSRGAGFGNVLQMVNVTFTL